MTLKFSFSRFNHDRFRPWNKNIAKRYPETVGHRRNYTSKTGDGITVNASQSKHTPLVEQKWFRAQWVMTNEYKNSSGYQNFHFQLTRRFYVIKICYIFRFRLWFIKIQRSSQILIWIFKTPNKYFVYRYAFSSTINLQKRNSEWKILL